MKLNCGPKYDPDAERRRLGVLVDYLNEQVALGNGWERWFAWRPVRVGDTECRWLEYVERRKLGWFIGRHETLTYWSTEYRSIPRPGDKKSS
jgi:hypothetical protein